MSNDVLSLMDEWGPEKVICVSDRKSGMKGVLVLDNTARGMGKGGTRMSPTLTVSEVARLARTMTWKWAAVDLFHGGAKAGILSDPHGRNKDAVLRAFARALANEVPSEYVFGLDMGLSEEDAAILADELGDRGAAVGLPRALGGLPYDELGVTGFGVAEATDAAARAMGLPMEGARVAIQGFGAVGSAAAERLQTFGAVVVGISTTAGSLYDRDGLDLAKLLHLHSEFGDACVNEYGQVQPADSLLRQNCDILVPAATQDVVDLEIAKATTAKLVVEGANMPTTPDALDVLASRGVSVVPDFIANAGGVIAAAFAMTSRNSPFVTDPGEVFETISSKLRGNVETVIFESRRRGISPHVAARQIAQERVREAMRVRGRIPADQFV